MSFNHPLKTIPAALLAFLTAYLLLAGVASAQPALRGFQVHSLWFERSYTDMERELDLVQQAGGNVVRVDIGWSTLESGGKGVYTPWYLQKLDRLVQEAGERNIKVLAGLVSTPCWASSAPETLRQSCGGSWWDRGVQKYPPTKASDFGDAARFITARYGNSLAALEVWNEPNIDRFLVSSDKPSAYAAIVKAAYPAAKAGNPDVPVVVGAIAAADRPFLDQLYARGIQGYYDGISVHPYNEWRDPYDRWHEQWKQYTFLPGMEWIREGQVAAGDTKPLWITEFGWTTCVNHSWCVSEAQQADYLVKAFQILNTLNYVYAATAYELRDGSTVATDFESNWGLVRYDFSEKPGFAAVAAQLSGAVPPPPPADDPAPDPAPAPEPAPEPEPEPEPAPAPEPEPAPEPAPTPRGKGKQKDGGGGKRKRATLSGVTLRLAINSGGAVYAKGRAPKKKALVIRLKRCGQKVKNGHRVRANRRGVYQRRIGSVRRLRGCRVTVRLARSRAVASRFI